MPGHGPLRKEQRSRDRDNPVFEEVPDKHETYGNPLPGDILPEGETWHPQTLRWWAAMRTFPLLAGESDLGWEFLIDTAMIHHRMWTDGDMKLAAELRLRAAKYAITPEDRLRLKIKVTNPDAPLPATVPADGVANLTERRNRLGA